MARKKQEIALQVEIETQEEWEEMLTKEGLTIVDVYQEWAGPCKAMISNFRKLKLELGDDILRFATAKADTVDALEKYRGRCKPCFLFYAKDVLVHAQRGSQVPKMMKAITEQLSAEHKVLDGQGERKPFVDPDFAGEGGVQLDDEGCEEEDEGLPSDEGESFDNVVEKTEDNVVVALASNRKGVTVAILKPNVVAAGKVDEIIAKIEAQGIQILEKTEMTMSKEDAEEFYAEKKDEEFYGKLIEFMCSGPSVVLALSKGDTGEGIVEEWRDLLGPANVEEAKESAPDSLRAQYGEESCINAVHGSSSLELAMQELAFFFPNFNAPVIAGDERLPSAKVQRTLALIRPDALRERKDEIMAKIEESGFKVAMQKEMQLTKEQAEEFYKEHKEQPYFEDLVNRMINGPLLALALARNDAISSWRNMLGPKELEVAKEEAPDSLRAQFAMDDVPINQLHGSSTDEEAKHDLQYFFPMQQTVAVVKPDAYQTKEDIMSKIKEAGFHIAAQKETELTEDIAKQFYRDHEGKDYFGDLTQHMSSGPTLFMVLSREDAVDGWRGLIGPTDPALAKEEAPESLRAQFGSDVKANAVHGSSNPEHAQEHIKMIFGDMEFKGDGTLLGAEGEGGEEAAADAGEEAPTETQEPNENQEAEEEGEKVAEATEQAVEQAAEQTEQTEQTEAADEQEKAASPEPKSEEVAEEQKAEEPEATQQEQEEEKPAEAEEKSEDAPGEAAEQKTEAEAAPAEGEAPAATEEGEAEQQKEG